MTLGAESNILTTGATTGIGDLRLSVSALSTSATTGGCDIPAQVRMVGFTPHDQRALTPRTIARASKG